jgi:hypothetical protein
MRDAGFPLDLARRLRRRARLPAPAVLQPLGGGGNNQLWRTEGPGPCSILKIYWHPPGQTPWRFDRERAFYAHCQRNAPGFTPQALAWDEEAGAGLFSWVPGRRPEADQVTEADVDRAIEFIVRLNAQPAAELPPGREACFSVTEHLATVERRVRQLEREVEGGEARQFVREDLRPAWELAREAVGPDWQATAAIPRGRGCWSPSDFGWHNAIKTPGGDLVFLDFEHAGRDDPAKLACDVLYQPEVPMSQRQAARFWSGLAQAELWDADWLERARVLREVYRIKWVCILLNEHTRAGAARRRFAGNGATAARKATQLQKARALLAGASTNPTAFHPDER